MLFKVRNTISRYNMLKEGDRVLVALSGGPDSVCLLYILKRFGLELSIAHLNHGLRGKESDMDQKFCERIGKKMGIPVYTKKVKIRKSEDAARNARYEFLEDTARRIGARKIALGHNADDEAETVLMRLLRGAGTRGMGGIPPIRKLDNIFIIRPLINVWRKEILHYLEKEGICYRIDSSNKELIYFRNRIRNELIPFLSRYNPNIKNILQNTGRNMAMVSEYLRDAAGKELLGCTINIKRLKNLHPIVQQELIRRTAEHVKPELCLESVQVDNILTLASKTEGSKSIVLPKGIKVIREYGKLIFCGTEKRRKKFKVELLIPGRVKIPEYNIMISSKLCKKVGKIRRNLFEVYLDYDRIMHPLLIRNRKPGDVFQPIGLKGKKKVKDIFIDKKVPKRYRDIIPIFVSGKDICWIPGYRIGEKFKIASNTTRAVKISVKGAGKLWRMQVQE